MSAERYAPADAPFGEPHPGIRPQPTVPHHVLRAVRASSARLVADPESVARGLLEDWLVAFCDRDVFADLASR